MLLRYKRAKFADKLSQDGFDILPAVIHQQNARTRNLKEYRVIKSSDAEAQVIELREKEDLVRHVVNCEKLECTCREWQITGKPCVHGLAFIKTLRNAKMDHFIHHYFNVSMFRKAYEDTISALPDRNQWPIRDKGFHLEPPILKKKGPGRDKKNRIPSFFEQSGKVKRQSKCRNCGDYGHRYGSVRCIFTVPKKR